MLGKFGYQCVYSMITISQKWQQVISEITQYLFKNCAVYHNVQNLVFFRKHNHQPLLQVVNMAGIRFDSAQVEMI